MNRIQRLLIALGVALIACMGLIPPWTYTFKSKDLYSEKPAPYHLIFSPPEPDRWSKSYKAESYGVKLDILRLTLQWTMVCLVVGVGVYLAKDRNRVQNSGEAAGSLSLNLSSLTPGLKGVRFRLISIPGFFLERLKGPKTKAGIWVNALVMGVLTLNGILFIMALNQPLPSSYRIFLLLFNALNLTMGVVGFIYFDRYRRLEERSRALEKDLTQGDGRQGVPEQRPGDP